MCVEGLCQPTEIAEEGSSVGDGSSSEGPDAGPGDDASGAGPTTTAGEGEGTTDTSVSDSDPEESGPESDSESTGDPTPVVIVPNGDFEQGTSGWTPFGPTTLSISTDQAHGGLHSVLVSDRTADWNGIMVTITGRVDEQVNYGVSGWVRLDGEAAEATARLSVKLTCSGLEPTYTNIVSVIASSEAWTQLTGVLVIPGGCAPNEVSLYFEGARVGADPDYEYLSFYVDDVVVTPSN